MGLHLWDAFLHIPKGTQIAFERRDDSNFSLPSVIPGHAQGCGINNNNNNKSQHRAWLGLVKTQCILLLAILLENNRKTNISVTSNKRLYRNYLPLLDMSG
jgi:hypothetical protein